MRKRTIGAEKKDENTETGSRVPEAPFFVFVMGRPRCRSQSSALLIAQKWAGHKILQLKETMMYPPWVVFHIPHDSTVIPDSVRDQYLLSDDELNMELARITDHHTFDLFAGSGAQIVREPVSRLVVDVERFRDDVDEPMSRKGMGAVYTATSQITPLRRTLRPEEREELMRNYYDPHHHALEIAVGKAIESHGRCLVVDCHSFPDRPLPYEQTTSSAIRPDICIGTDDFHTEERLGSAFVHEFRNAGFTVALNTPFAGALVPRSRYRFDRKVQAIMVEVNRRLYLHDESVSAVTDFGDVARRARACCVMAIRNHYR